MRRIISKGGLLILALLANFLFPLRLNADNITAISDGTLRRINVPMLMYHYISTPPANADIYRLDLSVTPEHFRQQMQWLQQRGYHTITPDQLAAALLQGMELPANPVLLTFDDGYDDAYINAVPILHDFGFTGTFFVVSGFIDDGRAGYLTWAQAKAMVKAGMSIENHSRTHKDMRKQSDAWLTDEIVTPGKRIEAETGVRPVFFCYPSGGFDANVIRVLHNTGYIAAFTEIDGTFVYSDNMMRIPRIRMRGTTTLAEFARLLAWQR